MVAELAFVCTKILWLTGTALGLSVLAGWTQMAEFSLFERFLALCLALGFSLGAALLSLIALPLYGSVLVSWWIPSLVIGLVLTLVSSTKILVLLRTLD
jgi:hypothetical protein